MTAESIVSGKAAIPRARRAEDEHAEPWRLEDGRLVSTLDPWADPRPDLAEDAGAWADLLRRAYETDGADPLGVFGSLQGARIMGGRLTLTASGAWRLVPPDDMPAAEWAAFRQKWLVPHAPALRALLGPGERRAA